MEKITIFTEKEETYKMTFAMLLAHTKATSDRKVKIKIDSYTCVFEIISE